MCKIRTVVKYQSKSGLKVYTYEYEELRVTVSERTMQRLQEKKRKTGKKIADQVRRYIQIGLAQ